MFEQFFCEAFLDPGDAVLVFSPHFPTYEPNIDRRGGAAGLRPAQAGERLPPRPRTTSSTSSRPTPRAKAIFLNSPHNPTGGVATEEDLTAIADLVRGTNIAVFSDEPYCHMVWDGQAPHACWPSRACSTSASAAYTFSKSYSMSGWRLGYAVSQPRIVDTIGKMINTSLSCVPPIVQLAGEAALEHDAAERDEVMPKFHKKVELLVDELRKVDGVTVLMPAGTFYVFPNVSAICQRLGITSHGLAMYLLEGADDKHGVACLGGECFGAAAGLPPLQFAEPDERPRRGGRVLRRRGHADGAGEGVPRSAPEVSVILSCRTWEQSMSCSHR